MDELELPPDTVGLLEGLTTTRTVRRYADRPVTDEELGVVLFAATRAPSGSNRQPHRFLVLRRGPKAVQARAVLGAAARQTWKVKRETDGYDSDSGASDNTPKARMARAMQHYVDHFEASPVIVLGCLVRYRQALFTEGASIYPACQNLLLAARAIGLGAAMTQWQARCEPELREILSIPGDVAMHATITLGHPAGRHGPVRRRPVRELVYEDVWGEAAPWARDPPGTRFTGAGVSTGKGQS